MARLAGSEGRVSFGGSTVECDAWTLTANMVHHRRVPFYGGAWDLVAEVVSSYSATVSGTINPADSGQNSAIVLGTSGTIILYEDYDSSNYWTGTGYVTDIRENVDVSRPERVTITLLADGDWSRT